MISAEFESQLERFVRQPVAAGRHHPRSEMLRDGVRLIQDRGARLATLDAAVARSLEGVAAGRTKPAMEVFARLRAKYHTSAGMRA